MSSMKTMRNVLGGEFLQDSSGSLFAAQSTLLYPGMLWSDKMGLLNMDDKYGPETFIGC